MYVLWRQELAQKLQKVRGETLTFFRLSAPELVSNMSGESESNIRGLFEAAKVENLLESSTDLEQHSEPCLVFIDEIDAVCPRREGASKDMEKRIVAQLLTSFDGTLQICNLSVVQIWLMNHYQQREFSLLGLLIELMRWILH